MAIAPSNHADEQFALAQSLWQHDEVARAEAILRDLVARNPAREDAAMLLAHLLRSQGRFDAAAATVFNGCRENLFAPGPSLRGA
ncbi:MAG: tetratricopeptide repeat protein, partial [Rudaea sp.]